MTDDELLRYSRQIMLPEIDLAGQQRLADAAVLVVGLGGLGSPVAMYLAAAGVGRLVLVDPDQVELSNLQRQIIHGTGDLGRAKIDSAADRLLALNPGTLIERHPVRFDARTGDALVAGVDLVIDGSDNFATRFAINAACLKHGRPLVSGAAGRFEGQVSVFTPGQDGSPCYRCLYSDEGTEQATCTTNGVISPLLGIIGSIQALEAIKLITGAGQALRGRLLCLDALNLEWRTIRLAPDPACPACGSRISAATA